MSIFDTRALQTFEIFNGKSNGERPDNTDTCKSDIIESIIDTLVSDVVARDSLNNHNHNGTENGHISPGDSNKQADKYELTPVRDPSRIQIVETSTETVPSVDKVLVKHRLKKKVKRLSRKQLEKFITEKTQDLIKAQTEVGKLQATCHGLKKEIKEWKDKSDNLAKSCSNLAKLVKLNIEGNESRPKQKKFFRSVGIQVKITTVPGGIKRALDEKEESCSKKQNTVDTLVTSKNNVTPSPNVTPHLNVTPHQNTNVNPLSQLPPLPASLDSQSGGPSPPKPNLKLTQTAAGLEVYWTYNDGYSNKLISSYELYAHQDTSKPLAAAAWKKVGDIKSIPLPIRCTLSHFKSGSTYFFVVRAKNLKGQFGQFSDVQKICLK